MNERDGGPAFPYSALAPGGPNMYADNKGMSLRDYFAAQMLIGVFASGRQIDIAQEVAHKQRALEMGLTVRQVALETNKLIAAMTYEMADAMLTERAK